MRQVLEELDYGEAYEIHPAPKEGEEMSMGFWERLYHAINKFPKKRSRDRIHESRFRNCPWCGKFLSHIWTISTRQRIVFENKIYVGHHSDVYNKAYMREITWAPSFTLSPGHVYWCAHCGVIIIHPELEVYH